MRPIALFSIMTILAILLEPPVVVPSNCHATCSPSLVTAYKASGAHMHVVQLHDNSSAMVPVDGVPLFYVAGGPEYEKPLADDD